MESKIIKVFVSYAHKSFKEKDLLLEELKMFEYDSNVVFWADDELRAGEEFDPIIKKNLDDSDIGLILIDNNSIGISKYIREIEIPMIFEKQDEKLIYQFPVLVKKCRWERYTTNGYKFNKYNIIPKRRSKLLPIKDFKPQSDGWYEVFLEFEKLIEGKRFKEFIKAKDQNVNYIFDKKNIHNIIESYIQREELETEIFDWYFNGYQPICYLVGQAGTGKTTLSRYITKEIQENNNKDFVIWIESAEWEGYRDIETILKKYFKKEDGDDINLKDFIKNLDKNILIILDGVNEKGATSSLSFILNDYLESNFNIESKKLIKEKYEKMKLLFVTRSIADNVDENIYKTIKVGEFGCSIKLIEETELHLHEKIKKYTVQDIENIPRYSKLLKDINTITLNLTQYREIMKFFIVNILNKANLNINDLFLIKLYDLVNMESDLFIDKIKNYLDDESVFFKYELTDKLEIIEDIGLKDIKSDIDFTKMIFMLSIYIIKKYDEIDKNKSFEDIVKKINSEVLDKFQSYGDDFLAKVPYVVFRLSVERYNRTKNKSDFHAALFYIWIKNHNTHYTYDDMMYWFGKDFDAFIQVFEKLNFEYQFVHVKDYLFKILCTVWYESNGQNYELKNYLKSIFLSITTYKDSQHMAKFRRSIIILAHFPTVEFLDIFIELLTDLEVSKDENKFYTLHLINEKLSILFRFGYQEDMFDKLKEKDEYKEFVKLYKSYDLSEKLSLELKPISLNNDIVVFVDKVTKRQELFNEFNMNDFNLSTIEGLANLACRTDLEFHSEDKKKIVETLEHFSNNFEKKERGDRYLVDWIYDSFPYLLASFDEKCFNNFNSKFLFQVIKQKAFSFEVNRFNLTIAPNDELPKYILLNIDSLVEFEDKNGKTYFINQLIEVMLFTADVKQLESFFNYLIVELKFSNIFIRNHPVDIYIRKLFDKKLLEIIYKKLNSDTKEELKDTLMTYLFLLHDFNNINLTSWAIEKLKDTSIEKYKKEFARDILINTSPAKYFEEIYLDKDLKMNFYESNSSRGGIYLTHWLTIEKNFYSEKSFEALIEILPLDTVGNLLYYNERDNDIDKWGKYIFNNLNPEDMNDFQVKDAIKEYATRNIDEFKEYAIKYLNKANDTYENGGLHFPSVRTFEDSLSTLLIPIDFDKAVFFYNKTKDKRHIANGFVLEVFNTNKYTDDKYKEYRKEYIKSLKNDMDILHIARIMITNDTQDELKKFMEEWLSSKYATDRLLAVSVLPWYGNDYAIKKLQTIKTTDDSEYVRYFASWSVEVAKQEKYVKIIYEEALQENDLNIISSKLYQIKPVITPTSHQWGVELNDKYELYTDETEKYKKVLIQRFWNIIIRSIEDDKKFEINKRKLSEYYRGEKITDANRFITGELK